MRGHRGRTELVVRALGRSVHASAPHRGLNPLPTVARFILRLQELDMARDPDLGGSTVAPTLISVDQTSPNVIPSEVVLICDWRNVPGEGAQTIRAILSELGRECADEGVSVEVDVPKTERTTYAGYNTAVASAHPAFILPATHPFVQAAAGIASEVTRRDETPGVWGFATDGGHFAEEPDRVMEPGCVIASPDPPPCKTSSVDDTLVPFFLKVIGHIGSEKGYSPPDKRMNIGSGGVHEWGDKQACSG